MFIFQIKTKILINEKLDAVIHVWCVVMVQLFKLFNGKAWGEKREFSHMELDLSSK